MSKIKKNVKNILLKFFPKFFILYISCTSFSACRISHIFVGQYIYMEGSFGSAGDRAKLISPELRPAPEACMTFWYNMYGYEMGNLSLFSKVTTHFSNLFFIRCKAN